MDARTAGQLPPPPPTGGAPQHSSPHRAQVTPLGNGRGRGASGVSPRLPVSSLPATRSPMRGGSGRDGGHPWEVASAGWARVSRGRWIPALPARLLLGVARFQVSGERWGGGGPEFRRAGAPLATLGVKRHAGRARLWRSQPLCTLLPAPPPPPPSRGSCRSPFAPKGVCRCQRRRDGYSAPETNFLRTPDPVSTDLWVPAVTAADRRFSHSPPPRSEPRAGRGGPQQSPSATRAPAEERNGADGGGGERGRPGPS